MVKTKSNRDIAKQATREALILAGIAAFAEEGLDKPSLDAICARAGFTRGAFYVHFKDREDFQAAVMEHMVGAIIEALLGAAGETVDIEQSILTFAAAVKAGVFPQTGVVRTYHFFDACVRSPRVGERFIQVLRAAMKRVAEAMVSGQQSGRLRDDVDPYLVATLLTALVLGAGSMSELGVPFDVEAAAQTLIILLKPPA